MQPQWSFVRANHDQRDRKRARKTLYKLSYLNWVVSFKQRQFIQLNLLRWPFRIRSVSTNAKHIGYDLSCIFTWHSDPYFNCLYRARCLCMAMTVFIEPHVSRFLLTLSQQNVWLCWLNCSLIARKMMMVKTNEGNAKDSVVLRKLNVV